MEDRTEWDGTGVSKRGTEFQENNKNQIQVVKQERQKRIDVENNEKIQYKNHTKMTYLKTQFLNNAS